MAVKDWNNDGKINSVDDYAEYEGLYHSRGEGGLNFREDHDEAGINYHRPSSSKNHQKKCADKNSNDKQKTHPYVRSPENETRLQMNIMLSLVIGNLIAALLVFGFFEIDVNGGSVIFFLLTGGFLSLASYGAMENINSSNQ